MLIDESIEKTFVHYLSNKFLLWSSFFENVATIENKPEVFLSTYVFYVLNPPKGSTGITEAFLRDARFMCLIELSLKKSDNINAAFYKSLAEVMELEQDPKKCLLFLKAAKDYYETYEDIFIDKLVELAKLELRVCIKLSNALEKVDPDSDELFEMERKTFKLMEKISEYHNKTKK